jgi:hypothetical protein
MSFVAGLTVYFQKDVPLHLRIFPVFLFITFCFESFNLFLSLHGRHNVSFYNFYDLIATGFYLYILYNIIGNKIVKKAIIWAYILFSVFAFWNAIFWQKMSNFNNVTFALGSLIIVSFAIFYFIEVFQKKEAINLLNDPAFWICSGLIFFNTCALPYFGLVHAIERLPEKMINRITIAEIILNIFLYSTFAVSFLCRLRIRKYI